MFNDTGVSLRAITFNSGNSYIVAGGGHVSLVQGTANGKMGNSSITVADGTHQFQLNVDLRNNTDVNVANNSTLEFNNRLFLNANTLTKTGAGIVAFNNNVLTGGGTVICGTGDCTGTGTIGGDLINVGGTISPGNSAGPAAVPEPASVMLLLIGTIGFVTANDRKQFRTVRTTDGSFGCPGPVCN